MSESVTSEEFRRTLATFATGVTVVTATLDDVLHGMTANAFCSVSLDPPLVLVCVAHEAGLHDFLLGAKAFGVTVLAADQEADSAWFASARRPSGHDQFDRVAWWPAPVSGSPILERGIAWLDCRLHEAYAGGDHSIVVGEVVDLGLLREAEPLVYYRSSYRDLAPPQG